MSYRIDWKFCKSIFPDCWAMPMGDDWVRICKDYGPTAGMEFYELGSGRTREAAWADAAKNAQWLKEQGRVEY
jgi:hypothetical protein